MKRNRGRVLALATAVATLAICVGLETGTGDAAPTRVRDVTFPPASLAAATKAALRVTHGKKLGGSADFLGVVTGAPADALTAALKPFEDATGVKVNYEATFSQQSILQTRVQAGNPPDVVFSSYPIQLKQLARQRKLVPLNGVLDRTAMAKQYPKALLDLGTVNGKLYAYFSIVNYHGLIWFNPSKYTGPRTGTWAQLTSWAQGMAAEGRTPWCLGIESGAATGWPAANELVDALFVRKYGAELATQWEQGKLKWTSPQVRWAWQTFGSIFTNPKMVAGGAAAIASTNYLAAGNGLFSTPATCYLLAQEQWYGEFAPFLVQGVKPTDVAYFRFPSITPKYKDLQMVDGNQVALLRNRAQGRALVAYMATPEFETLLAESGQFLVPNSKVSHNVYPTPLARNVAKVLVSAKAQKVTIMVPSVLLPVPVTNQFFKDLTAYIQNPSQLDSLLRDMDSVVAASR
jgi:alpha-glucoside transport system substrate-binding protein